MPALIDTAIARGLQSLELLQLQNGAFRSFSSADPDDFGKARPHHAVFPTALVLGALSSELKDDPRAARIARRAARYLLSQKSASWSFNYWQRNSRESREMPYPDDLDDTFAALSALDNWNGGILDGAALAKIVRFCFQAETKAGGPYRTWLVGRRAGKIWQDVDLAVNANVGYFWARKGVTLPGLDQFIGERLAAGRYGSPYYPSPYPILYFLSRFWTGRGKDRAVRFLLRARNREGHWRTALETALALSALLRWGVPPARLARAAKWLIRRTREGAWNAEAFYIDPEREGARRYGGAPALTTAVVLEALALYRVISASFLSFPRKRESSIQSVLDPGQSRGTSGMTEKRIAQKSLGLAYRRLRALPVGLRAEALGCLQNMAEKGVAPAALLLPYRTARSFKRRRVSAKLPLALGAANILGWAAYDLLDDIWDGDAPVSRLPAADALAREAVRQYLGLLPKADERELFLEYLCRMDEAARWELEECRGEARNNRVIFKKIPRFGNYSALADRSMPHAFAALAVLFRAGFGPRSKECLALLSFFRSYLIARQLNDDAHDWEEDLFRGRLNPAGAMLIGAWGKKVIREKDREALRKLFWEKVIFRVAEDISKELRSALRALHRLEGILDTRFLREMLSPLEKAARRAIEEAGTAADFLKIF